MDARKALVAQKSFRLDVASVHPRWEGMAEPLGDGEFSIVQAIVRSCVLAPPQPLSLSPTALCNCCAGQ